MGQEDRIEDLPFWRRKRLEEMSAAEWESLCDGCGRCCLHKLQADDTKEVYYLDLACSLLDTANVRCVDYKNRFARNVGCCDVRAVVATPELNFYPPTCAYRLLGDGQPLPWWHPLVSGDPSTVFSAGISVAGRVIPESKAGELEYHTVDWPRQGLPDHVRDRWTQAMFGGVNASVPTAFTAGRQVDIDLMADHCFWLLANGCNGLAILDKAGEVASLAIDERMAILEGLVARGIPPSKLLAGIGPASPADAARIAGRASELGVRGVLLALAVSGKTRPPDILSARVRSLIDVVPPGLHLYFSMSVADGAIGACLTATEAFLMEAPGRLRGIVDEARGCRLGLATLDRFRDSQLEVYAADAASLDTLIRHGGAGLVGLEANVVGRLCATLMQSGTPAEVSKIRGAIENFAKTLRQSPAVPALKSLLARHSGRPEWERVRLPLRTLRETDRTALLRAFDLTGIRLQPAGKPAVGAA